MQVTEENRYPNRENIPCADVLTYNYASADIETAIASDVEALTCTFDLKYWALALYLESDLVFYEQVLIVSGASDAVVEAFVAGDLTFTITKDIVDLECTEDAEFQLTVDYL